MIHSNPRFKDREALAPYNFVSLPDKPSLISWKPIFDTYRSDYYTGEFVCTLTTETPVYIRGPLSPTDFQNGMDSKNKSSFSLDNGKTPRIPASSLRGLFRHMVAIISNSRMGQVTDQRFAFRAVDTTKLGQEYRARIMQEDQKNWFTPRVRGGFVRQRNGEWFIQPAQDIGGTTWCRISHRSIPDDLPAWPSDDIKQESGAHGKDTSKNARAIYIQPGAFEYQEVRGGFLHIKFARTLRASATPAPGLRTAALAPSGDMLSKRSEAIIFAPDPKKEWLPMRYEKKDTKEKVEIDRLYRDQITDAQRALLGRDGALKDFQPVFYLTDEAGNLLFFGHTLMLRTPYNSSPHDLIPSELQDDKKDLLDLAEAIFGTVRHDKDGKNLAIAGRVFFSDGAYQNNIPNLFERIIRPMVLSGPKPTTFQQYLAQPQPDEKEQLQHYDDRNARIRGDKLYWHRGRVSIEDVEERNPDKLRHLSQYTEIQAVKQGAEFKFTIKFENLRLEELGALAWVLRVSANPQYRLKLGMGKPHGMGAVQLDSVLRLTNRKARYTNLFSETGKLEESWLEDAASQVLGVQAISDFERFLAGSPEGFAKQRRIIELLTLLSWPGPEPARTRYLEIERRDRSGKKTNEYRLRPVLPDPMFVVSPRYDGESAPIEIKKEEESYGTRNQTPPPRTSLGIPNIPLPEVSETASPEAEKIAQTLSKDRLGPGDVVVAVVIRITANDYECQLEDSRRPAKLPKDEIKGLKETDKIRARVKRIAGSGTIILSIRGV